LSPVLATALLRQRGHQLTGKAAESVENDPQQALAAGVDPDQHRPSARPNEVAPADSTPPD
jgi:hypothetical protein